jgi:telomerase Cajal body protein 1
VFDVATPGAEGTRLATTPSKKSKDGFKGIHKFPSTSEASSLRLGIISSLAFSPSWGGDDVFAAGSLTASYGNVALFSAATGGTPQMFAEGGPKAAVTQVESTIIFYSGIQLTTFP